MHCTYQVTPFVRMVRVPLRVQLFYFIGMICAASQVIPPSYHPSTWNTTSSMHGVILQNFLKPIGMHQNIKHIKVVCQIIRSIVRSERTIDHKSEECDS
jgi:hypothetical protein